MFFIIAIFFPLIVHESGHYFVSLYFKKPIRFKLSFIKLFKYPIPRFVWDIPTGLTKEQIKVLMQSGFVLEFLLIPLFPISYFIVTMIHFILYPWYAQENSDFKYF